MPDPDLHGPEVAAVMEGKPNRNPDDRGREVLLYPPVERGLVKLAEVCRMASTHVYQPDVAAALAWIASFETRDLDSDEPRWLAEVSDPRGTSRAYAETEGEARRRAVGRFVEDVGHTDTATTEIAVRRIDR